MNEIDILGIVEDDFDDFFISSYTDPDLFMYGDLEDE